MDQFFALVGGAVDPLGDWVFLGSQVVGSLAPVMVPVKARKQDCFVGEFAAWLILDDVIGCLLGGHIATGTSFCAVAYLVFIGLRIDNNKINKTIFVNNNYFWGTLIEILVAALVVWQYDRRHPRELRPINVQPEIMLIALSRRGGINQCEFVVVGLALPKSERKCDKLCRTDICDRGKQKRTR
eukprot:scaffold33707_cov50-Attheya_sp.AAC.1